MFYPIRINKYLADKKIASRREADLLIKEGKVIINGKKSELGEIVRKSDRVEVKGDLKKLVYLVFNKPVGIITHSPQGDEISIADILKFDTEVFPLGRLDKDSHGLIILTNDGRTTDRLLNPMFEHEKEYEVEVDRSVSENFIKRMEQGVKLDGGYITQKCVLKKNGDNIFSIILTEGKKRQIRRMCAAFGYEVIDLKRVRVMNIELGNLKEGHYRIISEKNKDEFLRKLEL